MAVISQIKATSDNVNYNIRDDYSTWGGRNLVYNTRFLSATPPAPWVNWGSPTTREVVEIDGINYMHLVSTTNKWQGYSQNSVQRGGYGDVTAGDQIIVSFDAYAKTAGQTCCIGIHWGNNSGSIISQSWYSPVLTTTSVHYISPVYTVPANCVGFNLMIGSNSETVDEIWMAKVKVEKGNKATDWSPAPEDIARFIGNETIELYSE